MIENKIYIADRIGGLMYKHGVGCVPLIEDLILSKTDKAVSFMYPEFPQRTLDLKEMMESINRIKDNISKSDILIFDLDKIFYNANSLIQLGIVIGTRAFFPRSVYVLGVGQPNPDNPWIKTHIDHYEETPEQIANYITNYCLN